MSPRHWPYPFWIAHRGAGTTVPENTLAAFREGYRSGFQMFECDVKLSRDHMPFLLHDSTLDRTTNGQGLAGTQTWQTLQMLDAGSWHSPLYAGEPLATLTQISQFCLSNQCHLNVELKPSPGQEALTGTLVAQAVDSLWQHATHKPLLTSFSDQALLAASHAAPDIPRGLLSNGQRTDCREVMLATNSQALVCHHAHITADLIAQIHGEGWYCLAYTVNDPWSANDLIRIGIDGIITDQLDLPEHMRNR